ncbi:Endoplasmic reticulum junction formation protein lunapark-B [Labeo rohita]|uniref:Endoplasmic reticulum junction formation protein lunapark-B n=1 Tax=Labeo rohita TaxID=84645 RepID=A0ABQ8MKC9_LABRO|nr:Endoplasmic reticulum junction formation protein lunapark-B [Labeo rohita]
MNPQDIKDLEEFRAKNQRLLKLWVGRLLFYSSALYLITCLCVYYLYFPEQWTARLITALPLLAFPALVLLVRKLLIFLFSKRTERNNEKLDDLKTQKRKILEEVMETETYKNAKVILERFDPESKKKAEAEATPARPHMTPRPGQDLRQRHVAMSTPGPVPSPMSPGGATPLRGAPGGPPEKGLAGAVASPTGATQAETPQMMRRSMSPYSPGPGSGSVCVLLVHLSLDPSFHESAALWTESLSIWWEMDLRTAFRCAYCYFMNPARKTRPQAPRLPEFSFERRLRSESPETQSSAATETPEDSDAPEDDIERTTTAEPQDPTAEDPPAAHESEQEEAQSQQSPPPSEDVQQEEAEAQEQQQKEDESN